MNAADLVKGKFYTYREHRLEYNGQAGRTWYFTWLGRYIYCLHQGQLKDLKIFEL